jgi:small-conductance mechanosensitive channel
MPDQLQHVPWSWVAVVLVLAGAILAYRLLARQISSHVADSEKRHRYRKRVGYTFALLVVVVLSIAFFQQIRSLGTMLGFIGAGLAIALREYLTSFLAWFYILGQRNIALGSRIELGGVRGDVIDIGVFKLTLVEVRGEGLGDQSSGRLVTIPNFKILTDPVLHFTLGSPYVWDEMEFTVTFESDWEDARVILERVGREIFEPHRQEIEAGFRQLEHEYAFRYGVTTPIVYVAVAPSGVQLKLRYLTHVRQRRDNRDLISRRVLKIFAESPGIEFAYTTTRTYRTELDMERFGERPAEPRGERGTKT